jgi:hypothetical protein
MMSPLHTNLTGLYYVDEWYTQQNSLKAREERKKAIKERERKAKEKLSFAKARAKRKKRKK